MPDQDTLDRFERALEQSVADGASPDEIESALDRMTERVQNLRIARGEHP